MKQPIPHISVIRYGSSQNPTKAIRGTIQLPAWNGYFLTQQPNQRHKTRVVTDGRIELWVDGQIHADDTYTLDPEQVAAYTYLVTHGEEIRQNILQALREAFPRLMEEEYGSWDHGQAGFPEPGDLKPGFDFKAFIGPSSIHLGEDTKEGSTYVTWEFECLWDPEHGFQVITHNDRVIDIGPEADIFRIYADNDTLEEVERELEDKQWKRTPEKKWWQFWK